MAYASATGTRRNLAALRERGWGLLYAPASGILASHKGFRYCLDNGAWAAFTSGLEWSAESFLALLDKKADGADFVVAPDIVEGGPASLTRSFEWLPRLLDMTERVLIPVQDGMTAEDLGPHVGPRVGLFVGGSTEWKESSLPMWGALKRETGCWLHVGRVNSVRRTTLCVMAGADSVDGSSATRFAVTIPKLAEMLARERRERVRFEAEADKLDAERSRLLVSLSEAAGQQLELAHLAYEVTRLADAIRWVECRLGPGQAHLRGRLRDALGMGPASAEPGVSVECESCGGTGWEAANAKRD